MSAVASEAERPLSYESVQKAHLPINLSYDARRLMWALQGPLSSAIQIMEGIYYDLKTPLAPYCLDETTVTPTWDPISLSPLTEPPVSSTTASVEQLDEWENTWLDFHRDHAEPGPHNTSDVRFGRLPDYDPDFDEEWEPHLLRCCGCDRPRKKKVLLLVEASGDDGILTTHDFISAVHPWLMGLRGEILQAAGDLQYLVPLPANTKLVIDYPGPKEMITMDEKEW